MATTVTTTWEQDEKYTWSTCPYTWSEMVQAWKYAGTPVAFTTVAAEENAIAEDDYKDADSVLLEPIRIESEISKDSTVPLEETVSMSDSFSKEAAFARYFTASITTEESTAKDLEVSKAEKFSPTELNSKEIGKPHIDGIELLDSMSRTFKVWRTFEESIDTEEIAIKEFEKAVDENVEIYDAYVRNADGIISNIYIETEEMDEEGFNDVVNTPGGGYTRFYEFKVGEYEYQEALVRLTIETTVYQSEPNTVDVVMHVDIPDTDDSGIAVITDTENATKVYFNKSYYTAPEVAVIIIGGNTGDGALYANLVSVDGKDDAGRYFEVEILNSSGELATGTISWFSKGY